MSSWALIISILILSFSAIAETIDYKPLPVEVRAGDRLLIRGFKGQVRVQSQAKAKNLSVKLRQINPDKNQMSPELKEVLDEWLFSVQRREQNIEVIVRSPQSKKVWSQMLVSGNMPSFMIEVTGPAIPLDIALKQGPVRVEDWTAPVSILANEGAVEVLGGNGDLKVSGQTGAISVKGRKGKVSLESYSGKILVSDNGGQLQLENFSGDSEVNKFEGPIQLSSTRGSAKVVNSKGRIEFFNGRGALKLESFEGAVKGVSEQGGLSLSLKGEPDVRVTTKEGNVFIAAANSGAYLNLGTSEGRIAGPSYLSSSQTPSLRLMQGRMRGNVKGQIYVRTEAGAIQVR